MTIIQIIHSNVRFFQQPYMLTEFKFLSEPDKSVMECLAVWNNVYNTYEVIRGSEMEILNMLPILDQFDYAFFILPYESAT